MIPQSVRNVKFCVKIRRLSVINMIVIFIQSEAFKRKRVTLIFVEFSVHNPSEKILSIEGI